MSAAECLKQQGVLPGGMSQWCLVLVMASQLVAHQLTAEDVSVSLKHRLVLCLVHSSRVLTQKWCDDSAVVVIRPKLG